MSNIFSKLGGAVLGLVVILDSACASTAPEAPAVESPQPAAETRVKLPPPRYSSSVSVEESLLQRRSVRAYSAEALTLAEVAQLLWAAQGITHPTGLRTAPSAGALYPLEVYIVAGKVKGLAEGVYQYHPREHELTMVTAGDLRPRLCAVALGQDWIEEAAINLVLAAAYHRTTRRYGERGIRYVHIEVGHAAQNVCLQAIALGLDTVPIGAFHDDQVKKLLKMPLDEEPLYIIPVGRKR